jgi:hypothetical protein
MSGWQDDQERAWQYSQQLRREDEIREYERLESLKKAREDALIHSPRPPLSAGRHPSSQKQGSPAFMVLLVIICVLMIIFGLHYGFHVAL